MIIKIILTAPDVLAPVRPHLIITSQPIARHLDPNPPRRTPYISSHDPSGEIHRYHEYTLDMCPSDVVKLTPLCGHKGGLPNFTQQVACDKWPSDKGQPTLLSSIGDSGEI